MTDRTVGADSIKDGPELTSNTPSAAQTPPVSTPAPSQPSSDFQSQATAVGTSAAPATTQPGAFTPDGQAAPIAPAGFSAIEYLEQIGFPKGRFTNEREAWDHVVSQAQQAQQQAQQIREQAQQAIQYLRQQQAAAMPQQPGAPQKKKHFDAPEWDPAWDAMVEIVDGKAVAAPGALLDIVHKWLAAKRHAVAFNHRLAMDPIGTLGEGFMENMMPKVMEAVRAELQGTLQQQSTMAFARHVADTSDWAYRKDPAGRIMTDLSGQRVFTPEGQAYYNAVQVLEQVGVRDVRHQDQLARVLASGILALQQGAGGATQPPQPSLAAAMRTPSAAGSTLQPSNTTQSQLQNRKLSIQDQMRQGFAAAGVTDADFMRSPN